MRTGTRYEVGGYCNMGTGTRWGYCTHGNRYEVGVLYSWEQGRGGGPVLMGTMLMET